MLSSVVDRTYPSAKSSLAAFELRARLFSSVDASAGAREIFQVCIARSQVLTSVRPLMRPIICRGPVWEFADRIQITATRSRRSVENWLADPVSSTVRHTLLPTVPTPPTPPSVGASRRHDWSSVDLAFSLHGPRDTGHLVRQRHDDEHSGLAGQHPPEPRPGRSTLPECLAYHGTRPDDQEPPLRSFSHFC